MVDPGEAATETLIREFGEEACDSHMLNDADKNKLKARLAAFFKPEAGTLVYKVRIAFGSLSDITYRVVGLR